MAVQTSSSVLKYKKGKRENISFIMSEIVGGTVASWLVGVLILAPDRVVRISSSNGQGTALYSWDKILYLTVPLSTQVYKCQDWVPAILTLGDNPAME